MGTFPQSLLSVQVGRTGTEIDVYPVGKDTTPLLPLMAVGQEICLVDGTSYEIRRVAVEEHREYGDASSFEEDRAYYSWNYKVAKVRQ